MIIIEKEHLILVKNILEKHVPHAKIKVFGSRVNGKPKPYSDLDIAIDTQVEISLLTLAKIENDFEESNLPFRVDVMDWSTISQEIKDVILDKYEYI